MIGDGRDSPRFALARYLAERGAATDICLAAALGLTDRVRAMLDGDPSLMRLRTSIGEYAAKPPSAQHIYQWTIGAHRSPADRLLDAIAVEDEAEVQATLRDHPDVVSSLSPAQHAMLAHAAHQQRDVAFRLMAELGFDAAQGANDGGTALHQSAWVGRADYVELLLPKWRSLLDAKDPTHGATPLGWAQHGAVHRRNPRGDYARTIQLLKEA